MLIKKKDKIVVLRGRDKGKRGEVLARSGTEKYIVAKINVVKKHQKPRQDEKGGIIEKEMPIHQSKIMLVCPKCDSPTSPSIRKIEDKSKVRVCRNCLEMIE